jgi:hypothetical protein
MEATQPKLNQAHIDYIQKTFSNNFKFRVSLFNILPMGWLSGMKVTHLDETSCSVSVPYKRWNKNPFKSTFWAVLGMAAEMSSGALLVMFTQKTKTFHSNARCRLRRHIFQKSNRCHHFYLQRWFEN